MTSLPKCANCHQEIEAESIKLRGKTYCCEACAFEASQRTGSICGTGHTLETSLRYYQRKPKE